MRITFLVDNLPHPTLPLLTEHGLSMYIDQITPNSSLLTPNSILCDMGASGAFIKNAKALGIDLNTCHWAFLSHAHADHTGGLGKWIAQFGHIPVYASHRIATLQCFSSRPKKVASQCKVSAEASLLDYAEPQPDFMSEANKVESQRFNDSSIQHSRSELRSIGADLNLFHGHTPWFKPIEQNTWLTPHIALVHPTCSTYPKPLGNQYLTVVEGQKSKVESQCKVSAEASLLDYAEPQPDFMSEANKVASQRFNDSAIQHSRSDLRYIGADLNLFHGHTPWFKPIEQSQWLTPTIAMVFPTCSNYPTPLGNKYLYTDESTNRRIGDVLTTEGNNRLTPNSSLLTPNFLSSGTVRKTSTGNGPSTSSGTVRDDFSHEIALAFVTEKGLVIVSCCSHHGALNTIASCMEFTGCNTLHAYIGGLHFVDSPQVEAETTSFIGDWLTLYPNAHLYTGHCTCPRAATMLKAHIPHCHTFYTGKVVEV